MYVKECENAEEFRSKYQEKYSKLKIVPYNVADLHHSQDELHKVIRQGLLKTWIKDFLIQREGGHFFLSIGKREGKIFGTKMKRFSV